MSQFYSQPQHPPPYGSAPAASSSAAASNLQFYPSQYSGAVSGHTTPSQAAYGYSSAGAAGSSGVAGGGSGGAGYGGGAPAFGVSGRMGEHGGLRTGWLAAFGTEGYDGEPPLLEELGVNFGHIKTKTLIVLNPLARIDQHIMDDADLAGPVLFFLLFGTFLLFSGRLHFGYIYGLAAIGTTLLYWILGLMAPPSISNAHDPSASTSPIPSHPSQQPMSSHHHDHNGQQHFSGTLSFARTASVLGYCLLPLVGISLVGVAAPMDSALGYVATSAAIMWCTYSSSGMFVAVGRMRGMRILVAYPVGLFYAGFGIMGIFSSGGGGKLGGKFGSG